MFSGNMMLVIKLCFYKKINLYLLIELLIYDTFAYIYDTQRIRRYSIV